MATLYGTQYNAAYVAVPSAKIQPGDFNSEVKSIYFEYTWTAVPTAADIIKLAKLPKGARVLDFVVSFPDLGTTGVLEFGWAAGVESGVTIEAASASGFLAAVDVNTAAATVGIIEQGNLVGFGKEFLAEVDVQCTVTTAWTLAAGTFRGYIEYVIT